MSIRLQGLPALLELWDQLVQATAAQGITIDVADFGGYRTAADTAEILNDRDADYATYLANGGTPIDENTWRPIAPYGQSYHDYGAARDVKIVSAPAGMSGLSVVATIDNLAEGLGFTTGASFGDPLHVQLPISLDEAAGEWSAIGGSSGSSSNAAAWIVLAAAIGAGVTVKYSRGLATWH